MTTRIIDLLIPAAVGASPGVYVERIPGKIVTCITATAGFSITKDNGAKIPLNTGQDTGDRNAPEFGSLTFYNTTGAVITARIAVGYADYNPDKAVSANINQTITVTGKNAPTYTKGTAAGISGGGDVFNGLDGANPRKSFSVRNKQAAGSGNNISVKGANGTEIYELPPQESFVVETGGQISITGAGFSYAVCEVFYLP